ncbi:MAG: CapA family protein [Faecalicoccus sp.]|nr:CapA family protein [Faecalicoccus sp.]
MNKEKKGKKKIRFVSVLLLVMCLAVVGLTGYTYMTIKGVSFHLPKISFFDKKDKEEETTGKEPSSFTFIGVGDNLIHGAIWYQQEQAGISPFNFDADYELTLPYSQGADLAFINQETICAGAVQELSHYPMFNGPTEILDAVANAGFDWMAVSSNHTMDAGPDALLYHLQYIQDTYPDMRVTGSHLSEEAANTPIVIEVNGIKVGLLGMTYGLNGMMLPEDMPWLVDITDENLIRERMAQLDEVSDVQLVSMHWGTEYSNDVDDNQRELTTLLNELGAEVIIGTHPHVIETAEIYHGDKQDTLVYYSLGNFLSAQDAPERMVGGMANFTLNYDFDTKTTTFTDVKFIPTITWYDNAWNFRTTTIHEYTEDLAATHSLGVTREFVQEYVSGVVGSPEGIEVVLE